MLGVCNADAAPRVYIETFDNGPGGWYADRYYALPVWDDVAHCYSPWRNKNAWYLNKKG